jgi:hypothetical protein
VGDLFEEVLDEAEGARERIERVRGRVRRRRDLRRREPRSEAERAAWDTARAEVAEAEGGGEAPTAPPPPPIAWHWVEAGEAVGPADAEALRRAAREGRVGPDTLVWTTGFANWRPAREVRALDGVVGPPPVPPPA